MVTVLLCGSEKDIEVTNMLIAAIRSINASLLHITAKTVSMLPPDAVESDFLILDNAGIHDIHMMNGIVVFKSELSSYAEMDIPAGFIAVTDSENDKAIEILQKYSLRTVTCGLSQRDTITYSSLDSERALISQQREIKGLYGQRILPHEIPVTMKTPYKQYPLLAAMGVLLLSELSIPENGLEL